MALASRWNGYFRVRDHLPVPSHGTCSLYAQSLHQLLLPLLVPQLDKIIRKGPRANQRDRGMGPVPGMKSEVVMLQNAFNKA